MPTVHLSHTQSAVEGKAKSAPISRRVRPWPERNSINRLSLPGLRNTFSLLFRAPPASVVCKIGFYCSPACSRESYTCGILGHSWLSAAVVLRHRELQHGGNVGGALERCLRRAAADGCRCGSRSIGGRRLAHGPRPFGSRVVRRLLYIGSGVQATVVVSPVSVDCFEDRTPRMNDISVFIWPSGRCTKSTSAAFCAPAEPSRVYGVCYMCKLFTFVPSSFFLSFNLAQKRKKN